ncbi:MAG: acetate--CoA ligase [Gammaproteobacteria bacterium]
MSTVLTESNYSDLYKWSIKDPDNFWDSQASHFLDWIEPWGKVMEQDPSKAHAEWFKGAKINVSYNCLDRHLEKQGDKTAIIWEGDDSEETKTLTYKQLHQEVCRFSNVLKRNNVQKGDRVCIYMPLIIETAVAMLACARIGAVHSVVFGGFSAKSLSDRIIDADCKVIVTANEGLRGGKVIPIKEIVDQAVEGSSIVDTVIVVKRNTHSTDMMYGRDIWYHDEMARVANDCPIEVMQASDPLFILYTSGSTGKPKGILHGSAGYLLHVCMTHKYIFDHRDDDIYWCTADLGWVTGHSYVLYGPLANGATTLMFEGVPTFPDESRYWEIIDKYKVNTFYTSPTILRTLTAFGNKPVKNYSLKSLRLLGTVGEPIDVETWNWYFEIIGKKQCPIIDTWWQTETGGVLISQLPGELTEMCGSKARPFFGIQPSLVDDNENLTTENSGNLVIKYPWPGQMLTIYGDQKRFEDTYFTDSKKGGYYYPSDRAIIDDQGAVRVTGRADDTLNVSGHLFGATEIESALIQHGDIAEAAVVGFPHPIKGEGIYAFVAMNQGIQSSDELHAELNQIVREQISAVAKPDVIHCVFELPKTRSGKIMRRILRKISNNDFSDLGDTSTLLNPSIVAELIESRENIKL